MQERHCADDHSGCPLSCVRISRPVIHLLEGAKYETFTLPEKQAVLSNYDKEGSYVPIR